MLQQLYMFLVSDLKMLFIGKTAEWMTITGSFNHSVLDKSCCDPFRIMGGKGGLEVYNK